MTDTPRTYRIGGGRGDRIAWLDAEQFDKPGTHFKVAGWKPRIPKTGDFLLAEFEENGLYRFQFTKVEPQHDPPDMFFGTVAFVGRVGGEEAK